MIRVLTIASVMIEADTTIRRELKKSLQKAGVSNDFQYLLTTGWHNSTTNLSSWAGHLNTRR
jgi:hypothetical protein